MSTDPRWILSGTNLIIDWNGSHTVVNKDHHNYKLVLAALKSKNYKDLEEVLNPVKAVEKAVAGKFTVADGVVLRNGEPLPDVISTKILAYMKEDLSFDSLVNFHDNVMRNPSNKARKRLYEFLANTGHPLTDDGCFIAYKRVNTNFKDFHSGKFDNSVGKRVSMKREDVDDDDNHTCSAGLHVCSWDYLPHYHGGNGVVIDVKVNPYDVVSIPYDYDNTKMRTCGYDVLACSGPMPHLNSLVHGTVRHAEDDVPLDGSADLNWNEEDLVEVSDKDLKKQVTEASKNQNKGSNTNFEVLVTVRADNRAELPTSIIELIESSEADTNGNYFGVKKSANSFALSNDADSDNDIFIEYGTRFTKSFLAKYLPNADAGDKLKIKAIRRTNGSVLLVVSVA